MIESITLLNTQDNSTTIYPFSNLDYLYEHFQTLKAISWVSNSVTFELANQSEISFYPVFNLNKIAITWYSHNVYKEPSNLVLYNDDATVHKIITVPIFIDKGLALIVSKGKKKAEFSGFAGIKEIDGQNYLMVDISSNYYEGPYYQNLALERRALDVESGEFHPTWNQVLYQ